MPRLAARAAPQARQCADRFHLQKNLGEALEGVLARHLAAQPNSQAQKSRATPLSNAPSKPPRFSRPKEAELSQAKREERLARYQHVVALRNQGFSQTAIASQVGLGHATVSRWLSSETFPEQHLRQRMMALDPYLPFLQLLCPLGRRPSFFFVGLKS